MRSTKIIKFMLVLWVGLNLGVQSGFADEYHDAKVKLFGELKKPVSADKPAVFKKWEKGIDNLCLKLSQDPALSEKNLEILIAVSPQSHYLKRGRGEVIPVLMRLSGSVMDRSISAGTTNFSLKIKSLEILNSIARQQTSPADSSVSEPVKIDSSYYFTSEESSGYRKILLNEVTNADKQIRSLALNGLVFSKSHPDVIKALEIVRDNDPEADFRTRAEFMLTETTESLE